MSVIPAVSHQLLNQLWLSELVNISERKGWNEKISEVVVIFSMMMVSWFERRSSCRQSFHIQGFGPLKSPFSFDHINKGRHRWCQALSKFQIDSHILLICCLADSDTDESEIVIIILNCSLYFFNLATQRSIRTSRKPDFIRKIGSVHSEDRSQMAVSNFVETNLVSSNWLKIFFYDSSFLSQSAQKIFNHIYRVLKVNFQLQS